MNLRRSRLLLLASLLVVVAAPAMAVQPQLALGAENTIYQLQKGTYGDLFADGADAAPEAVVLALDVLRANGERERWLVPATASADAEGSELLVYERGSDRVYLFWETVVSGIHPTLYLTSFHGGEWGEQIVFIGSPFARKQALQMVISRASLESVASGAAAGNLTVLHVFWAEERPGTSVKRYAPIAIVDGQYAGSTQVFDLDAMMADLGGSPDLSISAGIADAIGAQPGKNSQACVVGFLDSSNHRLQTLEIELLPPVLVEFADKVRAELIGIGQRVDATDQVAALSAAAIHDLGVGFHDSVLAFMSERVKGLIEDPADGLRAVGVDALADKVRAELIGIGSRIQPGGLADVGDVQFLELSSTAEGSELGHLLKVTSGSSREAPEVDGEAALWLSESAQHVLVTWEQKNRVYYRETRDEDGGWTDVGAIELDVGISREKIYRTLVERVRGR